MGVSQTDTKLSSTGCSSFRCLCRARGSKSEKRRGSLTTMGQSKSVSSPQVPPNTTAALAITNGSTPKESMDIQLSTTNRNRVEGGMTSMITLTPRTKILKSRSISSLSKALRNRKWRPKRRGSISASFNMNDRNIKVGSSLQWIWALGGNGVDATEIIWSRHDKRLKFRIH